MEDRPWGKYFLWAGAALLGCLLLFFGAVIAVVRSPQVQKRLLTSLEKPAAEAGITYKFQQFSFDLFGDVYLKGVELRLDRPPLVQGQLALDEVKISYAFWPLLQQKLIVRELELTSLRGELRLNLPPSEPEPESTFGPKEALALLAHPPLTIETPLIGMSIEQLSLALVKGTQESLVELSQADLKAQLAWQKDKLSGQMQAKIPFRLTWSEREQSKASELRAGGTWELNADWQAERGEQDFEWNLEVEPFRLGLSEFSAKLPGPQDIQGKRMTWEQSLKVKRQGTLREAPESWTDLLLPMSGKLSQSLAFADFQLSSAKGTLSAQDFAHNLGLEFEGDNASDLWKQMQANFEIGLASKRLTYQEAGPKAPWSLQLTIDGNGELNKGVGQAKLTTNFAELKGPQLQRALAFENVLDLSLNVEQKTLKLTGNQRLDQKDLSHWSLDMSQPKDKTILAQLSLDLVQSSLLQGLHPGVKSIKDLGFPSLAGQVKAELESPVEWSQFKGEDAQKLTITSYFQLASKPSRRPEGAVRWASLNLKGSGKLQDQTAKLSLESALDAFSLPDMKESLLLKDQIALQAKLGPTLDGQVTQTLSLDGVDFWTHSLNWTDRPETFELQGKGQVTWNDKALKFNPKLLDFKEMGTLPIALEHRLTMKHAYASLKEVPAGFDPLQQKLDGLVQFKLAPAPKAQPYSWSQELLFDARLLAAKGEGDATIRFLAPQLRIKDQADIHELKWGNMMHWPSLAAPMVFTNKTVVDVKDIEPLGKLAQQPQLKELLKKLQLIVHADVLPQQGLRLHKFYAGLQHPLLQIHADGGLSKPGEGAFDARIEAVMPNQEKLGIKGKGRFFMPVQLKLYAARKLSLEAQPSFEHLSLDWGQLQLRDLDGRMILSEELTLDEKGRIGFLYLESQNPFVRVDFDEVEPYLPEANHISMKSLSYKHLNVGPLVQSVEVRQNLVRMNQLKLDGLGGSVLGRFYFDVHPSRLQAGFLGRFSEIHPELLKEPARQEAQRKSEVLTGRLAVNFEVAKRLAVGRVDLTRLGRAQLLSLFDVLDPDFQDEQLASARKALLVAYPQALNLEMQQGLMDMTLELGGAAATTLKIRSLPLSSLIQAYAGDALQNLEKTLQAEKDTP